MLGKRRQGRYVDSVMAAPDLPTDVFPERLRAARELRGWSQGDLASRCSMPTSSVGHFESGTRKPSFDNLRKLANALEVTTDYLLGRVDDPGRAEAGDPLSRYLWFSTAKLICPWPRCATTHGQDFDVDYYCHHIWLVCQ